MPGRPIATLIEQKTPVILESDISVAEAARQLRESGESAALIESNGQTVGILTASDIVERVVADGLDPDETPVARAMTENPVVIKSHCSVGHALYLMHEYRIHHVPVIHGSRAVCVICASDALASDLQEYAHDAQMLDHIDEII